MHQIVKRKATGVELPMAVRAEDDALRYFLQHTFPIPAVEPDRATQGSRFLFWVTVVKIEAGSVIFSTAGTGESSLESKEPFGQFSPRLKTTRDNVLSMALVIPTIIEGLHFRCRSPLRHNDPDF